MTRSEFDLIQRYFNQTPPDGYLGVGDDCAMFALQPGYQLAVSTDTLIQGRHFFSDADPRLIGHKLLAVNLSDLAAMGAQPKGCLLALSLPHIADSWLKAFAQGLLDLAAQANCPLIGGDTTRSQHEIVLGLTVLGQVPMATALRRDVARVGDDIWLTGYLGAPRLALAYLTAELPMDTERLAQARLLLEQPQPPFAFAPHLVGHAHAGIDISDGLLQDLQHVLKASHCGADIYWDALPMHPSLFGLEQTLQQAYVLTGGDEYQLCFTANPQKRVFLQQLATTQGVHLTRIGRVHDQPTLQVLDAQQQAIRLPQQAGFDHFLSL